jgi:uncharacterized protein (DUF58 family)
MLRVLAAWTAAALLAVSAPPLEPVVWSALLVGVLVVAWDAWRLRTEPPPVATRTIPERAFVGQDVEVGIELANRSARDIAIEVLDEPAEDLCREEPLLRAAPVRAGGRSQLSYQARPERRGTRPFGSIVTLTESPLGLLRRRTIHDAPAVLRVFPHAAQILREGLHDPFGRLLQSGSKTVRRRGEGMDLESLRDYVEGDDPRRIHWAASARRGRPVVRVNQHESNHAVMLVVDTSRLMGVHADGRSKLDHAVDAAIALGLAALAHGDRVGVAAFDARVHTLLPPRASRRQFASIVDSLQPLEPATGEASYRDLVRTLCARQRRRCLVMILTDFVEIDPESLVVPLRTLARQHSVVVAALRDPVFSGLESTPRMAGGAGRGEEQLMMRRLVLDDLAATREATLSQLRRGGVWTIDAMSHALTASLVNRYLELRYGPER